MDLFLVYLICFGVGLLFAIVSAFMSGVFGSDAHGGDAGQADLGHEAGAQGHAEAGFGTADMPGFSPLNPTTLATFVTAFGGLGMVFHKIPATHSPMLSLPLSILGALLIAAGVFWLFATIFRRTQSSSESRVSTVVGLNATIITPIPQHAVGEIAYVQAGTRYTAPARSESGGAIGAGATVQITRIVGTQFYVRPA